MTEEARALKAQLQTAATNASTIGINGHFIPTSAPNFGGLWEAGVKSMKYQLKRVTHDTTLTFEELYTILKQVEASLNSRPLSAMSDDPQDFSALTTGHFLVGRPLLAISEPSILDEKVTPVKRWNLLTQMHQSFWRRWSIDYLQQLQNRSKWYMSQTNVAIGQLVLVRDERLPPRCWVMGRIIDTHAGADDVVRVVTIKTKNTILKRPISKISLLPIDTEATNGLNRMETTISHATFYKVGGVQH
ncbi:uncharacterized protein LOC118749251 [Rhagoletis pomonella]|uniref:uncharacterized protein LOC118749251 n=1 Tax=Rhagoletis pomonella TaxID=28610 RepID=UPI0017822CB7|nr:uncharacterized protein LOC118749251 [Rhagoletis pomonella]XP_036339945.1 uncharacterized protein LOC118749251 [Rhagoletis pomonella]